MDAINAVFQFGGAFFIALAIREAIRHKGQGAHWGQVLWFTAYGIFSCAFMHGLEQTWSFIGATLVASTNLVFASVLVYFRFIHK